MLTNSHLEEDALRPLDILDVMALGVSVGTARIIQEEGRNVDPCIS